jgi:25S rRNA (cytosine2278-C5)-methyltransferase
VYSTCSIHAIENERVVRDALMSEEARTASFELAAPEEMLPAWHRRGLADEMGNAGTLRLSFCAYTTLISVWFTQNEGDASSLIRCAPGDDGTNGFFVSCFVRREASSDAQVMKGKTPKRKPSSDPEDLGTFVSSKKKKRR